MLEVCASKIGDIILSVLESKMENKLDEVKKAKIISDTRKSICEFEEKYLQNHDGTVLTSREFGEYLQYSKPIEEIFSTIWDTSTEIAGTTEIVEKTIDTVYRINKGERTNNTTNGEPSDQTFF